MNRRTARSILFSALLLVSALTIVFSNYPVLIGADSNNLLIATLNRFGPLVITASLSPVQANPDTPVSVSGSGFDATDTTCSITSPTSGIINTTFGLGCQIQPPAPGSGNVLGSFRIAHNAPGGIYTIIVTGCTGALWTPGATACSPVKDSFPLQVAVGFVILTTSTTTSTTTQVISTSFSTLTTTTNFFSTLTTTTISSIARSTETDFFFTLITVTSALNTVFTTISTTVTSSVTSSSTSFTTETVVLTSPATTSALVLRPLWNYHDSLAVLGMLLLLGWMVFRRTLA